MLWFGFALLTALSVAARDVSIKTFKELQPLDAAAVELFWAIPPLALGCLLVPVPDLDQTFWWAFLLSIPINVVAYILYIHAIKFSPISLTVPLLAFTPVFIILTGLLTLGETVNIWGGLGIICIVLGSYVLNSDKMHSGILQPFIALTREKGSWLMLIVAFLYAFGAVVGKKAILHSSPLFFAYFFFLVFNLIIVTGLFITGKTKWHFLRFHRAKGAWLAGLMMVHVSCHALAIALATAAYMIAVKRSSILISVLLSWVILKEGERRLRGLATVCMFCGILLITLLG